MSSPSERPPLAGVRVIDWTHVLSGPFVGYQLALLGADVIRIERADRDDLVRVTGADAALTALGLSEAFVCQGAGKRSMALDARDADAQVALAQLIGSADVLVENFRPGKLARLGFDPAALIQRHPRLVVCSITGYGPGSSRRAYDHVVQAASGLMVANRSADGQPQRIGFPLVDYAAGQQAALAILAALYRRAATQAAGQARACGEWLQVTMAGAALTLLTPAFAEALVSGTERPRSTATAFSGSPLSGSFQVRDGWLAIVCNAVDQATGLRAAMAAAGVPDADLAELDRALAQRDVSGCQAWLQGQLMHRTAADWDERLAAHGVPAAVVATPVQAARQASADWPQVALPATATQAAREVRVPGPGFASTQALTPEPLRPPPRRGQHTRAILSELGWDDEAMDRLEARGVALSRA